MSAKEEQARPAGPAPELTLDLGARLVPRLVLAGVVITAIGLAIAVALVADPPSGGGLLGSAVVAGVAALLGVLCLWAAWRGTGLRIVLDEVGVHWRSHRRSADLPWDGVERVGVSITIWSPPRTLTTLGRGERTARITLALADPDAPAVAGALRHLRRGDEPEPWTHWIALGTHPDWAAQADAALERLVGDRYDGVHERETFRRRYS